MSINIEQLSIEELVELNKQVVIRVKELQAQAEINAAAHSYWGYCKLYGKGR
jgi:hypothetical protein